MSEKTEETLGCVLLVAGVVAGGWWLYSHYEIRKVDQAPVAVIRPAGLIQISAMPDGTVWRLDADSVSGTKDMRQAWVREDHSKEAGATYKEVAVLYRVNCQTTAFQTLKRIYYDATGQVQFSMSGAVLGKDPDYAPPNTYLGTVVSEACRPEYGSPVAPSPPPIIITPTAPSQK